MEKSRESKQKLRKRIRELRKNVTTEEKDRWDSALCEYCLQLLEEDGRIMPGKAFVCGGALSVYLYMDVRKEAGTRRILEALWARKIPAALPRVEGEQINFYIAGGYGDLSPGSMGIPEPSQTCPRARDRKALVLVPGMAFDVSGRRLGYGGGYYDRFFAREPQHPRWGLAYGFQMVEELVQEDWDQRVERVITPDGYFDCI